MQFYGWDGVFKLSVLKSITSLMVLVARSFVFSFHCIANNFYWLNIFPHISLYIKFGFISTYTSGSVAAVDKKYFTYNSMSTPIQVFNINKLGGAYLGIHDTALGGRNVNILNAGENVLKSLTLYRIIFCKLLQVVFTDYKLYLTSFDTCASCAWNAILQLLHPCI
uniref:Uncharacterized protein n=1 Tax=Glossina pallidipes TaxID=7398 RepID=A0A1B0A6P1_GLOPL